MVKIMNLKGVEVSVLHKILIVISSTPPLEPKPSKSGCCSSVEIGIINFLKISLVFVSKEDQVVNGSDKLRSRFFFCIPSPILATSCRLRVFFVID